MNLFSWGFGGGLVEARNKPLVASHVKVNTVLVAFFLEPSACNSKLKEQLARQDFCSDV